MSTDEPPAPEPSPPSDPVRAQGPRRRNHLPFAGCVLLAACLLGLLLSPSLYKAWRLRAAVRAPAEEQPALLLSYLRWYPDDEKALSALGEVRTWVETPCASAPPARTAHGFAAGPRQQLVLFGGLGAAGPLGDTWLWDGATWSQRNPAAAPSARRDHGLTFDSARERTLLFGGADAAGRLLGDTWLWDGSTWQQVAGEGPPPRAEHGLAFDPVREVSVLFGGRGSNGELGDTWLWDGDTWREVSAPDAPLPRRGHDMAFDPSKRAILLLGGRQGDQELSDLWSFGLEWRRHDNALVPTPQAGGGLAGDPDHGTTVLLRPDGDTWEWAPWNQTRLWARRLPQGSPGLRRGVALAWDPFRRLIAAFGGEGPGGLRSDLWTYGPIRGYRR